MHEVRSPQEAVTEAPTAAMQAMNFASEEGLEALPERMGDKASQGHCVTCSPRRFQTSSSS